MGGEGDLDAIAAAAAGARNLKPIQVEGNTLRVDLDSVGFGYREISREIIRTRLVNNEVVVRIRDVDAGRSRRGLEVGARLYFIQPLHRRCGSAWRSKAALGKS